MRDPFISCNRPIDLTPTETETLALAGTMTVEEIASKQGISQRTVRCRISQAREKQRDIANMKVAGIKYGGRRL